MIDLSKYTKGFTAAIQKDKTVKIIVAVGLLGMLLVLAGQLAAGGGRSPPRGSPAPASPQGGTASAEEYAAALEARLEELVGSIEGVGRAKVMVTLEHGVEYVYAQDQRQETQYSHVLIDTEQGRRQPLVRTQRQPKVQGVVVVCEGADDVRVQAKLVGVVTTALNIPTTRVYVVKIDG